ncbi:hypothetical protein EB796_007995 [Bugula neritina]|uniref:Berberine/berberine-like domain-containing protein n=1 Tax=Bugula neritina TaxID=10212 RepID=A0A7J7K654_BUGNE|nr:hypothetical protein EB796_007995 [Bugula neritina]
MSATYIRLGGQTRNTSSGATAVNPLFRNAMWTIAYGGNARQVKRYGAIIKSTVAAKGQYFSECDDTLDPGEWQEEFWGQSNYDRLLDIKRKYDPDNDFTCKQCVGSNATRYKISLYLLLLIFLLY